MMFACSINMKRFATLMICANVSMSFAQDPVFTQFGNSEWYINPAMAARDTLDVVSAKYRNQWPNKTINYQTSIVSYNHHFAKINGSIYAAALIDDEGNGLLTTERYSIGYAEKLKFGDEFLIQFGIELSYFQREVDWSRLTFGDQIDPRQGFVYESFEIPRCGGTTGIDISSGLLVQYKKLYLGFSTHHINEPDYSLSCGTSPLPLNYGAQLGYQGNITSDWSIHPYIWYNHQGNGDILYAMTEAQWKFLVFGVGYRYDNDFTGLLGVRFLKFDILYSYDRTYSRPGYSSSGAHEISARFKFWNKTPHDNYVAF